MSQHEVKAAIERLDFIVHDDPCDSYPEEDLAHFRVILGVFEAMDRHGAESGLSESQLDAILGELKRGDCPRHHQAALFQEVADRRLEAAALRMALAARDDRAGQ